MKAIQVSEFGGPEVLRLVEARLPAPGAGQVLVRMHATGVNPVETYIRGGMYPKLPGLPFTPGTDGAGVIEAVGAGLPETMAGLRVYVSGSVTGTYATHAVCEAGRVHALPDGVSFAEGAALGVPYVTAYRALLQRGGGRPGETVLVHGASGAVGTAAVQLARAHGLRVLGTAGTEAGCVMVREQGAHEVFDHREGGFVQRVLDTTDGRGVDLVLEMLANVNLDEDLQLLAPQGRVVVIGSRGRVEIDPRATMAREADIRGMVVFNTPPAELAQIHAALGALLEQRVIKPVIRAELPLAQAAQAHELIMQPGSGGKIVLIPG